MSATPSFDPAVAEAAIAAFLNAKLHPGRGYTEMPFVVFESAVPGVIAFERPEESQLRGARLDELAATVVRQTGIGIASISTWSWDTGHGDEDAMVVAFDIPELPEEYRDASRNRNRISPVSPETAPTAEDFVARDQAGVIIEARKAALKGMLGYLPPGPEREKVDEEFFRLVDFHVTAADRDINDAFVALDFDRAGTLMLEQLQADEPAASPAP